jgi:hypothetical protein
MQTIYIATFERLHKLRLYQISSFMNMRSYALRRQALYKKYPHKPPTINSDMQTIKWKLIQLFCINILYCLIKQDILHERS